MAESQQKGHTLNSITASLDTSFPFTGTSCGTSTKRAFQANTAFWERFKSLLGDNKLLNSALLITGRILESWTHGWDAGGLSCHHLIVLAKSRARSQRKAKSPFLELLSQVKDHISMSMVLWLRREMGPAVSDCCKSLEKRPALSYAQWLLS